MLRSSILLCSLFLLFNLNCSPPVEKFDPGIVVKTSSFSMDSTYQRVKNIIDSNQNLSIIAELNHQNNAASVNLNLTPTIVLMFGNPGLGTPLMQENQLVGLDLPQKILFFEEPSGEVKLAYNDPQYLKNRHGLMKQDEILNKIANALDSLTDQATK